MRGCFILASWPVAKISRRLPVQSRTHYAVGFRCTLSSHITTPFVPFTESQSLAITRSMNNLITVVTKFPLPAGLTTEQMHKAFDEVAPGFRNVPGLIRKHFLCSK